MTEAMVLGFTSPPLEVEPFDGMNKFRLWQMLVKDILEEEGLIETLCGKLNDMTDKDWKILELKAIRIITKSLVPSVRCSVTNETSPKAIWNKLESDYESRTRKIRLFQMKRLYELRMEEGTNIRDHVSLFYRLLTQLENAEVKIEEEDKVMALITSLPASYDNFVTNILSLTNTAKVNDMIKLLLEFKIKDESEDGNYMANVWIFGSSPFHVCSHRDWFDNYKACGGYIYPHIGNKIEIVGIGDVKVKMYDGSVVTLSGVRHVPTYITNMISVMRLGIAGYKVFMHEEATTVTKDGNKAVIMEGDTLPNGLFKLKGCALKSKCLGELRIESTKYSCF
jgi:hypothetical protein